MEIYLPIAEMSVHWVYIVGLGLAVGFLSGLFGVGGGFLLTPLLVFYGIPSTIAVGTTLSHVTASSVSGALAQWKKRAIDFRMAGVMALGGIVGTLIGVWLVALMRRQGQMDLIVSLSYVLLLGSVGGLMLKESLATLKAARSGVIVPVRPVNRAWIAALPFKMRFRQSRLYLSVIPPLGIGFLVGALSAIMGIGGGFIIVPAMIYILRMPTNVVLGTSLVQIIGVTIVTTILQATSNYAVDIVLAFFLVIGGVVGAQLGVRAGAKLRGEQLRFLLALVVLAVCLRLAWGLVAHPRDIYSTMLEKLMRRWLLALLMMATPAMAAEDVVSGLSQDQIEINSSYTGSDIVVFGTIERPAAPAGRDIVVVVRGPDTDITVRRRDRVAGVWINRDAAKFAAMPAFYFLASSRPLGAIAPPEVLDRYGLGAMHLQPATITSHHDPRPFRQAAVRQLAAQGLYTEAPGAIDFHSENLFKTVVPIPAAVARGQYNVEVYLFRDGDVESVQSTPFFIDQTGLERRLFNFAHNQPFGYGLLAVFMSLLFGWATSVLMRRPGS